MVLLRLLDSRIQSHMKTFQLTSSQCHSTHSIFSPFRPLGHSNTPPKYPEESNLIRRACSLSDLSMEIKSKWLWVFWWRTNLMRIHCWIRSQDENLEYIEVESDELKAERSSEISWRFGDKKWTIKSSGNFHSEALAAQLPKTIIQIERNRILFSPRATRTWIYRHRE